MHFHSHPTDVSNSHIWTHIKQLYVLVFEEFPYVYLFVYILFEMRLSLSSKLRKTPWVFRYDSLAPSPNDEPVSFVMHLDVLDLW